MAWGDKPTGQNFEYAPEPGGSFGGGAGGVFLGGGRYWKDNAGRIWEIGGDGNMTLVHGEGTYEETIGAQQPRPPHTGGGGGGGIPIQPVLDLLFPTKPAPIPDQIPHIVNQGDPVGDGVSPGRGKPGLWELLQPILAETVPETVLDYGVDELGKPKPSGPPGDGFTLPDWLEKLLKGLLLAGALAPSPDGGGGGPTIQGGGIVGGGAGGGPMGIGTTGYQGMRGGGNFVGWNPGRGQQLMGGGGGGAAGGGDVGSMMAQLFAGRR